MPTVYLRSPIAPQEFDQLKKEFPHLRFVTQMSHQRDWEDLEIIFGDELSTEELKLAPQLRWVHLPTDNQSCLCKTAINLRESVLVTVTEEMYGAQVAECAAAAYFAFAKNLCFWKEGIGNSEELLKGIQSPKGSIWLQLGLDEEGEAAAKCAKLLGFTVYGVDPHGTFSPNCHKVFTPNEIHSLLSGADVISICCRHECEVEFVLGAGELSLIKDEAILLLFCTPDRLNSEALIDLIKRERVRGIFLDSDDPHLQALFQPHKSNPRFLMTPNISSYPKATGDLAYLLFRHNLRQYLHGNLADMETLVQ